MLKPSHKKKLVEVITSDEYESPDLMVKALVDTLDDLRSEDTGHIVVCQYDTTGGASYQGYGPYPTRAGALKAVETGRAGIPGYGKKAIVPLIHPSRVDRKLKSIDELPDVAKHHWTRIRERVGI